MTDKPESKTHVLEAENVILDVPAMVILSKSQKAQLERMKKPKLDDSPDTEQ